MKIKNRLGLSVDFLGNGSLSSIEAGDVRISLRAATPFSRSGANLWLRKRTKPFEYTALSGPQSDSRFKAGKDGFVATGRWKGLDYVCMLRLSKKSLSWFWSLDINNRSDETVELDLICEQDVGLKTVSDDLINEYYVSQYIERRILEDKNYGSVICCRQNMIESAGNPWLMLACKNGASAATVDGMQFYGRTCRETGIPECLVSDSPGGEYAGESSVIALHEKPFMLSSGETRRSVFVATYKPDHPVATSEDDLKQLSAIMSEFGDEVAINHPRSLIAPVKNLFNTSGFLKVNDLSEQELNRFFDKERRHCEKEDGQLLSFFSRQNNHVMLRAKETMVDRPHGHIMQAEAGLVPDENIVSTTSFAYGVFNSHLTEGNTNFNIFLSVCSSQFNLSPETGQRIFVVIDGRHYLLGVPSAFEIGLNHCRWIYKHGDSCFQVRTWTSKKAPKVNMDFRVIRGKEVSLLITHHFDEANGWHTVPGNTAGEYVFKPKKESALAGKFPQAQFRIKVNSVNSEFTTCGDEVLYTDNKSRDGSLFILEVQKTSDFCMSFVGEICSAVTAEIINDADNQWLSDCHDARSAWQDLCLNLSLEGDHEDT
ncbi:MAG TPA: hypothetical protein VMV74_02755, partial [Bacteroidales bacterium]|nr:hypothetical protein [Bacteroidales bacterium]